MNEQEEKEKLKQLLKGRGYLIPPDARFLSDGKQVCMLVGTYGHSCHVGYSEFYALLNSYGELVGGSDYWWKDI
jgi:hypothetical protein